MTPLRYSVRALALSLMFTATGAFCVLGAPPPALATGPAITTVPALTTGPALATGPAITTVPALTTGPALAIAPDFATAADPVGGGRLAERGVIVNRPHAVPAPPAMPGASFLIADLDTGQILAAKAPHSRHLPASTLKTLTALTLIPILDPQAEVVVRPEDVRVDGNHLGILPGSAYSVETLLQGLMISSGNDAALTLARANRSVARTVKAMNATAVDLHALDTVAKNPNGLDSVGQVTSAYDLALIGRAAMKLQSFRRYVKAKRVTLPGGRSAGGKRTPGFKIATHNPLLYNYPGAIGIKTGFTKLAKNTFVGAATRKGKTYILTQMASPTISWRPTAALLDWAFTYGTSARPIGTLVERGAAIPTPAPAEGAPSGSPGATSQEATSPRPATPPAESPPSATPPAESLRSETSGESTRPITPLVWVGALGLLIALLLVSGWTARRISRTRTRS